MFHQLDGFALLGDNFLEGYRDQVSLGLGELSGLHLEVEVKVLKHVVCDATLLDQLHHELPILRQLVRKVALQALVQLVASHVSRFRTLARV